MSGGILREIPGQEFVDAIYRMICNATQDLAQVRLGIEPVELCSADETVEGGSPLATGIGAGEEKIFAAKGDRAKRAFGGVVVDLDAPIVAISGESLPA